jgi:hypothetical protein
VFVVLTAVKLKSGVVSDVFAKFAGEFSVTELTVAYTIGIARAIIEMTKSVTSIVLNLVVTMLLCKIIRNIGLFYSLSEENDFL